MVLTFIFVVDILHGEEEKVSAAHEIRLRQGQANDALADLRMALGYKSLVFRKDVRGASSQKEKTRSWDKASAAQQRVTVAVAIYRCARNALEVLKAGTTILDKYKVIVEQDLKISPDIVEENRIGQRSDTLAWFWRFNGPHPEQEDGWMDECTFLFTSTVLNLCD